MVNQVMYHIGMGSDPQGFRSFAEKQGVVLQAYSPLGSGGKGSKEIIDGDLTTSIGKKHDRSAVQVALKWILAHNVSVTTKSSNPTHLANNLDLFDFELDEADMTALDKADFAPKYSPSFLCADSTLGPSSSGTTGLLSLAI